MGSRLPKENCWWQGGLLVCKLRKMTRCNERTFFILGATSKTMYVV